MTEKSTLMIAAAVAASMSLAPRRDYGDYSPRSSGPKNGKTKRREKQKAAKKAKQKARASK